MSSHRSRRSPPTRTYVLGWREVPVAPELLGATARSTMPAFRQIFVTDGVSTGIELDRKAFVLRKRAEREAGVYFPSLSARTIVYKGVLTTGQLEPSSGPVRPPLRLRDRACALPVLHQHLPELAARPPVPLRRAQRRDQHGQGQPQLDEGPRVPAGLRPLR